MNFQVMLFGENLGLLLILLILGVSIGIIATIAGVGGGVMSMPIFLLILNFDQFTAKGTSLFAILLSSGVALVIHYQNGKIHLPSSLLMAIFAILGSQLCMMFQYRVTIEDWIFAIVFGFFELFIGLRLGIKGLKSLRDSRKSSQDLNQDSPKSSQDLGQETTTKPINLFKNPKLLYRAIPLFILAGFVATFFGIGGGVINTPTLYGVFKLPIHYATAGSTSIIFFTAFFNTISYGLRNQINWIVGIFLGAGTMIGGRFGAKFASKVPRWLTFLIIAILLGFTGIQLIFGTIS